MAARENSRLVYSTGSGTVCPGCGRPATDCRCAGFAAGTRAGAGSRRREAALEKAGRGGKSVTVVYDLPRNAAFLKELCQELKRACGVGGAVRDDAVELQGDLRDRLRNLLVKKGFGVKG